MSTPPPESAKPLVPRSADASATMMAEARAAFSAGDQPRTLTLATAVLKADPGCTEAYVLIGELALAQTGGAALAEKMFRQALALQPGDREARRLLATAVASQGRLKEAGNLLASLTTGAPADLRVLLTLAKTRELDRQYATAEAALRQAEQEFPGTPLVARALGDVLKRQGRLREALVWHRRSVGCTESELPAVPQIGRRALFVVQTEASWMSVASVHEAFAADSSWTTTIVAAPFLHGDLPSGNTGTIFGFLRERGVRYVRWDEFALTPGCADVAFFYVPYEETLPVGWRVADFLRAVPRIVYVPYALVVIGGQEIGRLLFNLSMHQQAWMIAAAGSRHRALFRQFCAVGDAHVAITGHPKMDALGTLMDQRDETLSHLGAGRKIVCWNPHFNVSPGPGEFGTGFSTFLRWHEFLLQEFRQRPGLALVIRPHPLLFSALVTRNTWSEAKVIAFRTRVAGLDNVLIDNSPTYLPVFAASAAMMSDASSLLLEYTLTGKPLLYLRNPDGPGLNVDGKLLEPLLYAAEQAQEIAAFLDLVERGEDPQRESRLAVARELVEQPAGGAGAKLKRVVEERLDREAQGRE